MKKRMMKAAAMLMLAGTMAFGTAAGVSADVGSLVNVADNNQEIQPVTTTKVTFKTTMEKNKEEGKYPNVDIHFTLTPSTTGVDEAGKVKVKPGLSLAAGSENEKTINFVTNGTESEDRKVKTADITFDFKDTFADKDPGIYRYEITEKEDAAAPLKGVRYDTANHNKKRILDVHVTVDRDNIQHYQYVMLGGEEELAVPGGIDGAGEFAYESKTDEIPNAYNVHNLNIVKEVKGNQGSKNSYFKFELNIENDNSNIGNTLYVEAPTSVKNKTLYNGDKIPDENPSSITIGANGSANVVLYLKSGDQAKIEGISEGAKYTVKESNEEKLNQNGYLVGVEVKGDETFERKKAEISDTEFTADTTVTYTNTRKGVVPTGVMMSVLPGAIILLIGACGILLFVMKRRRAEY